MTKITGQCARRSNLSQPHDNKSRLSVKEREFLQRHPLWTPHTISGYFSLGIRTSRMTQCERRDTDERFDSAQGLINGLLIAIPLWFLLGIVPVLVFQDGSIDESSSLALMIGAVCETILARPYLRALWVKRHLKLKSAPIPLPRRMHPPQSLVRQAVALSALVGAYLQFYFLEVNLQIASLNSVTVFLPVSSTT